MTALNKGSDGAQSKIHPKRRTRAAKPPPNVEAAASPDRDGTPRLGSRCVKLMKSVALTNLLLVVLVILLAVDLAGRHEPVDSSSRSLVTVHACDNQDSEWPSLAIEDRDEDTIFKESFVAAITPEDLVVRRLAGSLVSEGSFSNEQAFAIYDYVRDGIKYTSSCNPDVPMRPRAVLAAGIGDCKDKAVTLVSLLEAIGGYARVVVIMPVGDEEGHAYVELRISNKPNDRNAIGAFKRATNMMYYAPRGHVFCVISEDDSTWIALDSSRNTNIPGYARKEICDPSPSKLFFERPR